ncbi:MltR family transcriptional regulator [Tabrizicola caldifontis]|uniref:MltR family transcriptional regulator n=1 Tax=Tabrizicola caldifontis TaxID=2528036 RepID=UPI0010804D6A|nr:MltR family transcriptional regulator [Rhodobacter sp. YIM 73028]
MEDRHAEFLKTHPHLKDFLPLLETHNQESPRGAVLVSCAFLDDQLREIIDAFLIADSARDKLLEGFNAPIGTFSSRIVMAHCLGLISDKERDDCETLRKIRNDLAHDHKADFASQRIADLSANLHHSIKPHDKRVRPFDHFSSAAIALILSLINRAAYVKRARLERREWPT